MPFQQELLHILFILSPPARLAGSTLTLQPTLYLAQALVAIHNYIGSLRD